MFIKDLYEKYKDVIPYLFLGVCIIVVNIIVYIIYRIATHYLGFITSAIIAFISWILFLLFAYIIIFQIEFDLLFF